MRVVANKHTTTHNNTSPSAKAKNKTSLHTHTCLFKLHIYVHIYKIYCYICAVCEEPFRFICAVYVYLKGHLSGQGGGGALHSKCYILANLYIRHREMRLHPHSKPQRCSSLQTIRKRRRNTHMPHTHPYPFRTIPELITIPIKCTYYIYIWI